ncbi:hypothetical protein NX059_008598 [Plenodomus lindquistii]|nr:hypothetical protein NX059_008598 [Plenodomus lindquistii]
MRKRPAMMQGERAGKRKISSALLIPPGSESSSSSSAVSVSAPWIDVPSSSNSSGTFEFLGFTPAQAAKLYAAKTKNEQELGVRIEPVSWATASMEEICAGIEDATDDWIGAMKRAGIRETIIEALMKDEHRTIRLTQTLSVWLREIIETNDLALDDLSLTIIANLDDAGPVLRGSGGGEGGREDEIPAPEGHVTLYKSVEKRRCNTTLYEDGRVHLFPLESFGPTDFARRGGLYFTNQLWVATHYAALITDTCPVADRRTFVMHVPYAHLQEVGVWSLTFDDDDFRELLFCSRRQDQYSKDISRKRAGSGVIRGPIAHSHQKSFAKMKTSSDITPRHLLRNKDTGEISEQYVWVKEKFVKKLQDAVHGKCVLRQPAQGYRLVSKPWWGGCEQGQEAHLRAYDA